MITDSEFYAICQPLIGRSYSIESYNCRHLACDFMQEIGIDAYNLFGLYSGENCRQWRDSFRALSKSFKRVKDEPDFCLLLVYSDAGNHVAIKYKNKVLHNYGAGQNGQALLTDYITFRDSYDRISYYLFP